MWTITMKAPTMAMALAVVSSLRSKSRLFNLPSIWKLLALLYVLTNLKALPFAWHLRLLHGLLTQIRTSSHRLTSIPGPLPLFAPLITSSRSPLLECDYNLHKSNSTYFSDSDVSRLHLMVALCGKGIDVVRNELDEEDRAAGRSVAGFGWGLRGKAEGFGVRLGGVSAGFRREIRPYEAFELWTRILCWDRKWLYVVQHFVKKGTVKKGKSLLQPWGKMIGTKRSGKQKEKESGSLESIDHGTFGMDGPKVQPHPAIFASMIAKYVFKKGRLTVPPARVLRASELLPNDSEMEEWGCEVENERLRGLKVAELYSKLDALSDEFSGDGAVVLGEY